MIVNAMNLTEGKHYMLRVKGINILQKVKEIVDKNASIYGEVVSVYEYPGEEEVRVLLSAGSSTSTGFARIVTKLADLEGVR